MLRTLEASGDRFELSRPFRISRGLKTASEVVTVTIRQDGLEGRGEAVPYARYGETIAGTLKSIEDVRPEIENGGDRFALGRHLPAGAARNALDCALWDLEARRLGTTVAAMLGRPEPEKLVSAITVGLNTPAAMAAVAASIADAPLIKVKVDNIQIRERITAVREAAPDAKMIVDPNESWTIYDVADLQDFLLEQRVDLLEQPIRAGEDSTLVGFDRAVRICADEAVHVTADLRGLAGKYDVINIKIDKSGGLTEALELAASARNQGFGIMVGCMVCSSLGLAPALHLAAEAEFVDLDGPLWLADDYLDGVKDTCGVLSPPSFGFWGQNHRSVSLDG